LTQLKIAKMNLEHWKMRSKKNILIIGNLSTVDKTEQWRIIKKVKVPLSLLLVGWCNFSRNFYKLWSSFNAIYQATDKMKDKLLIQ
jgi:hypothetical protein